MSHWAEYDYVVDQDRHRSRLCRGAIDPCCRASQAGAADRTVGLRSPAAVAALTPNNRKPGGGAKHRARRSTGVARRRSGEASAADRYDSGCPIGCVVSTVRPTVRPARNSSSAACASASGRSPIGGGASCALARDSQHLARLGERAGLDALDRNRLECEHRDRHGEGPAEQAAHHDLAALGERAGRKRERPLRADEVAGAVDAAAARGEERLARARARPDRRPRRRPPPAPPRASSRSTSATNGACANIARARASPIMPTPPMPTSSSGPSAARRRPAA